MNILDIIILICFVAAIVQGLRKGFIAQVIAIISIIVGVWLSFRFSTMASQWLAQYVPASGQVLKIVAFALILILVIFALGALGKVIEATIKIVMAQPPARCYFLPPEICPCNGTCHNGIQRIEQHVQHNKRRHPLLVLAIPAPEKIRIFRIPISERPAFLGKMTDMKNQTQWKE